MAAIEYKIDDTIFLFIKVLLMEQIISHKKKNSHWELLKQH